jgi:hypothetical protein
MPEPDEVEDQWSYHLLTMHNPELPWLQARLDELGRQGWELVTSVSTHKVIAAVGNQLVFVFKKRGPGDRFVPPPKPSRSDSVPGEAQFGGDVPW